MVRTRYACRRSRVSRGRHTKLTAVQDSESGNPLNVSPANKEVSKPSGSGNDGNVESSRSEAEGKGERKVSGQGSSGKKGDAGRKL